MRRDRSGVEEPADPHHDVGRPQQDPRPGQVELGSGVMRIGKSSITVGSAAFKDGVCIAAAEMTVVRLKGKTPHAIDAALRTMLEKHLLSGF